MNKIVSFKYMYPTSLDRMSKESYSVGELLPIGISWECNGTVYSKKKENGGLCATLLEHGIQTFVADEELMQHLEKEAVRKEFLKQREAEMTDADWKQWYQLRDSARKLIEGISMLKSETAKKKRESNIIEKLNSANSAYPLKYENWMLNYWQKEM